MDCDSPGAGNFGILCIYRQRTAGLRCTPTLAGTRCSASRGRVGQPIGVGRTRRLDTCHQKGSNVGCSFRQCRMQNSGLRCDNFHLASRQRHGRRLWMLFDWRISGPISRSLDLLLRFCGSSHYEKGKSDVSFWHFLKIGAVSMPVDLLLSLGGAILMRLILGNS
jgi:hypothetical protein